MKRNRVLYKLLLIGFTCISKQAVCQFTYKADIEEVKQSGFHKIFLTPELSAKSNADFSDIRITDEAGKPVPYILNREQPVFNERELRAFPLVSRKVTPDSNVQMIFQPAFGNNLMQPQSDSSFVIIMQRAAAYRDASISGSDDLQNWYTIIDRFILDAGNYGNAEQSVQVVSLPSNRYKYVSITVKNKGLQPVDIIKAGSLFSKSIFGRYVELPAPVIRQVDSSNRKSYIALRFNGSYPLNKLRVAISNPPLYKRKIIVYDTSGARSIKVAETIIDPATDSLVLDGGKRKELLLVVENNDDQPLQLTNVTAYQLLHFMIADLQPGKKYSMLMGYPEAAAPVYDLRFFSDSIKVVEEEIAVHAPVPYAGDTVKDVKKGRLPFIWVWVAIGVVLLCLLWLTYRLIKDISNKRQQ
ncbi:MAG: hypothetical protein KF862_21285 [Chitinophagaceae bacterium]|nr:hypothetical protein [Chitinophagaceae bacterium]